MPPIPSNKHGERRLALPDGSHVALDVVRHPSARKWSLRYDPVRDRAKMVMPRRGSERAALRWVETKAGWVVVQRARRLVPVTLDPGAAIPFRGTEHRLAHEPSARRGVTARDGVLAVGGPLEGYAGRLARWLRAEALALLEADSREIAAKAGVTIARVGVGDARTRWGSCSSEGVLRYSWRLVLMPDTVRRYVVAHEVAHRVHMDHGPRFHALEAELYDGDVREARALLRAWSERVRAVA